MDPIIVISSDEEEDSSRETDEESNRVQSLTSISSEVEILDLASSLAPASAVGEAEQPDQVNGEQMGGQIHGGSGYPAEDDGEIEVVQTTGTITFPHIRAHCPTHAFKDATLEVRIAYCKKCYCFVCDKLAEECESWRVHCNATDSGPDKQYWRRVRKRQQGGIPSEVIDLADSDNEDGLVGGSGPSLSDVSDFSGQWYSPIQSARSWSPEPGEEEPWEKEQQSAEPQQLDSELNRLLEWRMPKNLPQAQNQHDPRAGVAGVPPAAYPSFYIPVFEPTNDPGLTSSQPLSIPTLQQYFPQMSSRKTTSKVPQLPADPILSTAIQKMSQATSLMKAGDLSLYPQNPTCHDPGGHSELEKKYAQTHRDSFHEERSRYSGMRERSSAHYRYLSSRGSENMSLEKRHADHNTRSRKRRHPEDRLGALFSQASHHERTSAEFSASHALAHKHRHSTSSSQPYSRHSSSLHYDPQKQRRSRASRSSHLQFPSRLASRSQSSHRHSGQTNRALPEHLYPMPSSVDHTHSRMGSNGSRTDQLSSHEKEKYHSTYHSQRPRSRERYRYRSESQHSSERHAVSSRDLARYLSSKEKYREASRHHDQSQYYESEEQWEESSRRCQRGHSSSTQTEREHRRSSDSRYLTGQKRSRY
mmetsp:Transcript_2938/g.4180  ORF Transcript_2938/g.4180 Transcript_2938/m.4180 type:complete len:644 (+) Transcript_2938:246-2177(+)